jgi:hypothetical protein
MTRWNGVAHDLAGIFLLCAISVVVITIMLIRLLPIAANFGVALMSVIAVNASSSLGAFEEGSARAEIASVSSARTNRQFRELESLRQSRLASSLAFHWVTS